jgi:uncharacterized coiled-coil protein SlyX
MEINEALMEINIEAVLGTLAVYFSLMTVLAVGTEIVLDILKVRMLKKPVSPADALTGLKDWVPKEKWDDLEQRATYMQQVIQEVDAALAETHIGLRALKRQVEPVLDKYGHLTPENIVNVLRELESRYQTLSSNRLAWIRFLSLLIGVLWAVALQVNTLDLLEPILADNVANVLGGRGAPWYVIAGLALSGIGAAAGSSFWYEQLARLREARKVVDTTEQLKDQAAAIASGIIAGQTSAKD